MANGRRERRDPSELTPKEAAERFLGRKRSGLAAATVNEYGYRLTRFREYCREHGIETVGDLHPLDFDDYLAYREQRGVAAVTLNSQFKTIRKWVEFLESLGAVPDDLHEAVPRPAMPDGAEISDTKLDIEDGNALIRYYRQSSDDYGTVQHALLELIWFTGARLGAVRSLDLDDVHIHNNAIAFRHRPETDTPLKNGADGERTVAIDQAVSDALRAYVDHNRYENRDDHGRDPFITSTFGRPSTNTIRNWTYQATQPCIRIQCPHDKQRATCEWTHWKDASKCPSSRSPHEVRTGAITRMLNHTDKDRVEYRANTTAFQHYDMASEIERLEHRDRSAAADLSLDTETDDQ